MNKESINKLIDFVIEHNININGTILESDGDYEIITYIDEVVLEDEFGNVVMTKPKKIELD